MTDSRAVDIGVRLVNLIDTGTRESTYKLATLLALCQYAVEHHDADHGAGLQVPLEELADRVIALYWAQREPFPPVGSALRQVRQGAPRLLHVVDRLRAEALREFGRPALWRAERLRGFPAARLQVAQVLAQMPLTHLQRAQRGRMHDPFLYDDAAFHKKMTRTQLDAVDWSIRLRPGIGRTLAVLSPLLAPLIEAAWAAEVRRFNIGFEDAMDLEDHLFGLSRVALEAVRKPLVDAQEGRCFYCGAQLWSAHVDHVLPWSRCGLNGLANLVACDAACNLDKSDTLPVVEHVLRARGRRDLDAIGEALAWPIGREPLVGAARGLLGTTPAGVRLWAGRGDVVLLTDTDREAALRVLR